MFTYDLHFTDRSLRLKTRRSWNSGKSILLERSRQERKLWLISGNES